MPMLLPHEPQVTQEYLDRVRWLSRQGELTRDQMTLELDYLGRAAVDLCLQAQRVTYQQSLAARGRKRRLLRTLSYRCWRMAGDVGQLTMFYSILAACIRRERTRE